MDALLRLHKRDGRDGRLWNVTRAQLLRELGLPETTVDDRLRVLVKQERVLNVGRGLYKPAPLARYQIRSGSPGMTAMTADDAGNTVRITWL